MAGERIFSRAGLGSGGSKVNERARETQFSGRNKKFAAVDGGRGDRPRHSNLCEFATYQNDQTGVGKLRTSLCSILNAKGAR